MILLALLGSLLAGALLAAFFGDRSPTTAAGIGAASVLVSLGCGLATAQALFTGIVPEVSLAWLPMFGVNLDLQAGGPALLLTLLGHAVALVSLAVASGEAHRRPGAYVAALLLALLGAEGCFLASDAIVFFCFFELMLFPGWYLIASQERTPERDAAANRFFLFTQAGGMALLLGVIAAGGGARESSWAALALRDPVMWSVGLMALGLGVKLPLAPLHTWLVEAYTRAPASATILFSGLLSKTGLWGLVMIGGLIARHPWMRDALGAAGAFGVIYGALLAWSQTDLKRLLAYSSLSHLGYAALGIAAGSPDAWVGVFSLAVAHGLTVSGLFAAAESLRRRTGTTELSELGGLWSAAPMLTFVSMFFAMGSIGVPGLVGFVGETITLLGAWSWSPALTATAQLGVVGGTLYATSAMHAAFMGPAGQRAASSDLGAREVLGFGLLALLLLVLGVWPRPILIFLAA